MCIHACVYVCVHSFLLLEKNIFYNHSMKDKCTGVCVCMHVCVCDFVYVHICLCVCLPVSLPVCLCVCLHSTIQVTSCSNTTTWPRRLPVWLSPRSPPLEIRPPFPRGARPPGLLSANCDALVAVNENWFFV